MTASTDAKALNAEHSASTSNVGRSESDQGWRRHHRTAASRADSRPQVTPTTEWHRSLRRPHTAVTTAERVEHGSRRQPHITVRTQTAASTAGRASQRRPPDRSGDLRLAASVVHLIVDRNAATAGKHGTLPLESWRHESNGFPGSLEARCDGSFLRWDGCQSNVPTRHLSARGPAIVEQRRQNRIRRVR
jgi:hypothetical protein